MGEEGLSGTSYRLAGRDSTYWLVFLAVQDSSISDIVRLSVGLSQLTIRAYNHYNHYNHYRDSDLDLDLD